MRLMMKLINNKEIVLRKLKQTDKTLLQKWLTDKRVLNYWEGQSAIFDLLPDGGSAPLFLNPIWRCQ
jgi:hypothetical protein